MDSSKTIAKRLKLTREALGLRQAEIARAVNVGANAWSQFEKGGDRIITVAVAVRLRQKYGITLDWIYTGDPSGLPQRLHEKIERMVA